MMLFSPNVPFTKHPDLLDSAEELAVAGEQAGFTVAQMVDLLSAGLTGETLLDLIAWRFNVLGESESHLDEHRPVGCESN